MKHTQNVPIVGLLLIITILASLPTEIPAHAAESEVTLYLPLVESSPEQPAIFGIEMSRLSSETGLNLAITSGTKWIRRNSLLWKHVQPTADVEYNWEHPSVKALEAEMKLAAEHNLNLILIVRGSPDWAVAPYDVDCAPINPEHYNAFADFMAAAVARYSVPPFNVRYWEIGNEPDAPVFPHDYPFGCWGKPDQPYFGGRAYGNMLQTVYPVMKAANPDIQVLNGGLLLDHPYEEGQEPHLGRFFEGMLVSGAGNAFDILSFHTYDYFLAPDRPMLGPATDWRIAYLRELLERYDVPEKPMIRSENGLLCIEVTPECRWAQADYLTRTYVRSLDAQLLASIWYVYDNDGYHNTALIEPDDVFVPRPAYFAYRHAAGMLSIAAHRWQLSDLPTGIEAHRLMTPRGEVFVLWSDWPVPVDMQLPVPALAQVRCTDRDGGVIACRNDGGKVALRVGYSPIFVQLR
jgi:hypothetical protein